MVAGQMPSEQAEGHFITHRTCCHPRAVIMWHVQRGMHAHNNMFSPLL